MACSFSLTWIQTMWYHFCNHNLFFIPRRTIVAGYYGFTLVVRESVHLSVRPSVRFLFLDDNLSKHQWIFTKLGMCIDIVEIWFGIANGQISSIFDRVICPRHVHIFNGFSPNLVCALILWRSGLGLLMGKFRQFWTVYICPRHAHIFVS